jgi:hypothetical protein
MGVSVQELSYPVEQTILYLISSVNGSELLRSSGDPS